MKCEFCGADMEELAKFCPHCGYKNESIAQKSAGIMDKIKGALGSKKNKKLSIWSILSIISVICSIIMLSLGIDKMTNYYNGDYYSVNAYVGGDAYNYIINGTYSTSYFVLTAMFALGAIGLLIVHYLSAISKELHNTDDN